MKYFIITIFSFFIVTGCGTKNDQGKIYLLEKIQDNTFEQFSYGEERLMTMKEMFTDKSESIEAKLRIRQLYSTFLKIDSLTGVYISKISKMKIEMFNSFGEELSVKKTNSILHYDYKIEKLSRPLSCDFSKVKYVGESNLLKIENQKIILETIRSFRRKICEIITESLNQERKTKPFVFIDPQINEFKDDDDFLNQYDVKIKKSNLYIEDVETIKSIYRLLSKPESLWKIILNEKDSWIDDLNILLAIESDLLKVRALAFDQVLIRIGCRGEYNFTNILPIVYGPSNAQVGDTIRLKVFMAAYNAYQTPILKIFNFGNLEKIEKGIGYIKVVLPKTKSIEVKGNITLINKSGIPKTNEWNHKIEILPKTKNGL